MVNAQDALLFGSDTIRLIYLMTFNGHGLSGSKKAEAGVNVGHHTKPLAVDVTLGNRGAFSASRAVESGPPQPSLLMHRIHVVALALTD